MSCYRGLGKEEPRPEELEHRRVYISLLHTTRRLLFLPTRIPDREALYMTPPPFEALLSVAVWRA